MFHNSGAQWANPGWVELPPPSSPAYGHENLTIITPNSNTRLTIEEGNWGGIVVAVLRFNGSSITFE